MDFQLLDDFFAIEAFFMTLFIGLCIFVLICYIIANLGLCFTFRKASQPGFAAFVPFYREYIMCQVTGLNSWWTAIFAASCFIPMIGVFISLYFRVLVVVSMTKSFGKSDAWAIGLFFLGPIFYLILGVGSSTYLGPKPMHDIIFKEKDVNDNKDYKPAEDQYSSIVQNHNNYCVNCGTEIVQGSNECHNCGKRIF